jgi:exo-beta-1,3-glucanase (GH17 family)
LRLGLKINQGFWISSAGADSIDDGVDELIAWGQANTWDVFDYITIGNEAVLAGYVTVDELIAKIASVRAKLEAAGYTGKITTSEPPVTFENNPSLCNAAIDFVGVNPHAYFDTYSSAETAGDFVKGQVNIVQGICSKDIVVTETGYPSAGIVNGGNIPSPENQRIAIEKILEAMNNEVTILTTFNDLWKAPGPYGIEQSFGTIQFWT